MQVFLSSVQEVLIIVFILSLGYNLAEIKWFDDKTSDLFVKLVLNIFLPFNIIVNISSTFTKEELINYGKRLLIPFFSILLSYIIAYILAEIFKVERKRKGVFMATFSFSNSVFVGLPMSRALFGEVATPYILMYYTANTMLWRTLGAYGIACDASEKKEEGIFTLNILKRIFIPSFRFYHRYDLCLYGDSASEVYF